MRVAMVCPYSMAEPGGVQGQVTGLARALVGLGVDVEVIAPEAAGGDTDVGRAFPFRVNGSIASMAPFPGAGARTVRALRRGGFDVVHLHEPLAPSITIPALLAHPAPAVGTFHAAGDRTPYRWAGALLRRLVRRLDVRVAVSEPAANLARHHLGGTYEVLFNGVDPAAFATTDFIATDGGTVLFLARHEPRKGLGVLLAALSLLPPGVTVLIAGEGPATQRLRQRYPDDGRIRWLGRLSAADKLRHLRSASVVCAPSLYGESFGVVLLEAMACGTPVVASDLPGYRQLADHGRAAVLVPPGDPRAVAAALRQVLGDGRMADTLRRRGGIRARQYSMDALAARYAAIYERLHSQAMAAS